MAFDYTAVTAEIRDAEVEGFLADVAGSAFETRVVELAELADTTGPTYDVADDSEYAALVLQTVAQIKKVK